MSRLSARHLNSEELNALVSSHEGVPARVPLYLVQQASAHVDACPECTQVLTHYRRLLLSPMRSPGPSTDAGPACPQDLDWLDVVLGLWPAGKAAQLIAHAAQCEHCGPRLRAAARLGAPASPTEEALLASLKRPSRPHSETSFADFFQRLWTMRWPKPAAALIAVVLLSVCVTVLSRRPLSSAGFGEFAVDTHRQITQGTLALDVRSDSQQALNQWLQTNVPFSLSLPASSPVPGEKRPYILDGARLVSIRGRKAAVIAYRVQGSGEQTLAASLTVVPESLAIASGGIEADFSKVSFHYATIQGYKVVTWSLHGLTYALVSQESNDTQRSCMLCHFDMKDHDLTRVPSPLHSAQRPVQPVWQ